MGLAIFLLLVFIMPAAAQFIQSPTEITPAMPEAGARFGAALATGDVNGDGAADLIVGVPYADMGGRDVGQVLVYFGGLSFDAQADATLSAPTPVDEAHFGAVLATGDVNGDGIADILVGAPGATAGDQAKAGQVYIFHGGAMLDTTVDRTLQAPTPQAGARFGVSIAIGDFNGGGRDIAVGANLADVTPAMQTQALADAGEVTVFFGTDFAMTSTLRATTPQAGARFGTSVVAADLNNDMFDDVVVGGDRTNVVSGTTTLFAAGEAVVFFGAMTMMGSMPMVEATVDVTLRGAVIQSGAAFARLMIGGDLNGDGIRDVVVAAPLFDTSNSLRDAGEGYVFQGATGITGTPTANATIRGPLSLAAFYSTSLALGDVDGDGLLDIIAGAPGAELVGQPVGRAFILLSGAPFTGVLTSNIVLQAPTPQPGAGFGQAVAAADFNQDGLAEVTVSAPFEDIGQAADAGRAYVFFSSAPTAPLRVNP
jgi:hypothetical protein